jgi:hypothetical protein
MFFALIPFEKNQYDADSLLIQISNKYGIQLKNIFLSIYCIFGQKRRTETACSTNINKNEYNLDIEVQHYN